MFFVFIDHLCLFAKECYGLNCSSPLNSYAEDHTPNIMVIGEVTFGR